MTRKRFGKNNLQGENRFEIRRLSGEREMGGARRGQPKITGKMIPLKGTKRGEVGDRQIMQTEAGLPYPSAESGRNCHWTRNGSSGKAMAMVEARVRDREESKWGREK